VPEYVATITAPKGIPPRRHQDLVVRWKLMDDPGETHDVSLVARMGMAEEKTREAFSSEAIADAFEKPVDGEAE